MRYLLTINNISFSLLSVTQLEDRRCQRAYKPRYVTSSLYAENQLDPFSCFDLK